MGRKGRGEEEEGREDGKGEKGKRREEYSIR